MDNSQENIKKLPPKWCNRLLLWYCKDELHEEILGDLEELYPIWIKKKGVFFAKLLYLWAVIRFFRPYTIKRKNLLVLNELIMYRNYFKIGLRNIYKYKLSSVINIGGMSVAIGCAIVVYVFVEWYYNRDDFHKNKENIFMVTSLREQNGSEQVWGSSPEIMAKIAKDELSNITKFSRFEYTGGIMKYGDLVFSERLTFVDPDFLEIFTFPLKYGNKAIALKDKNGVVLSKSIAEKYFGTSNPIGKQITLYAGEEYKGSFFVRGVAEKIPYTTSFVFEILVPYEVQKDIRGETYEKDWVVDADATFFMLDQASNKDNVLNGLKTYKQLKNQDTPDWAVNDFGLMPLTSLAKESVFMRSSIGMGSHPASVILLAVMGIFLLTMACLNYMNISIASASRRLKEIGLRKVIGGYKGQIVRQFLFENFLVCFIALVLGVLVAEFFLIPGFNNIIGIFQFSVDYTGNWRFWTSILGILLVTGLAAGSYPAFYISSFKPINIFRGKVQFGSRKLFSRIMLTFQFTLAFLTIMLGLVIINNTLYLTNLDWGYQREELLVVPLTEAKQYELLKGKISDQIGVQHISGSEHLVGRGSWSRAIEYNNTRHEVRAMGVSDDYLQTLNFNLLKGRHFIKDAASDEENAIIINQKMANYLNWENPIDKQILLDSTRYTVVGMVEDFHFLSFYQEMEPALFYISPEENYNYLTIRSNSENFNEIKAIVSTSWKELFPEHPYDGMTQSSIFDWQIEDIERVEKVMSFIAIVALLLTAMGMFGLVSLTVVKRMKEFSIRKVLGANLFNIAKNMNMEFLVMLLIAVTIGTSIAVLTYDDIMGEMYKFRSDIGIDLYIITACIVVFTAILTVSTQLYRVATSKTVDTLKTE